MEEIRIVSHNELPDHVIEHIQDLEDQLLEVIYPLIDKQRMDISICALTNITSKLLVTSCREDIDFLEKYKDKFIQYFENHVNWDIETMKNSLNKDKS